MTFFSVRLFILIDFGAYKTGFLRRSVRSGVQHNKLLNKTNGNQVRWEDRLTEAIYTSIFEFMRISQFHLPLFVYVL